MVDDLKNVIDVAGLLRALESPLHNKYPIVNRTTQQFLPGLESLAQVYRKLAGQKQRGFPGLAERLLLARCINDLIVGFHLVRQGYFIQANTVLRPILESLNLLELFLKHPELAELWYEGGKKARKAFQPTEVRKKLGRPSYDEHYGFFCEIGSHPTFVGARRALSAAFADDGTLKIRVFIGGLNPEILDTFNRDFLFASSSCFVLMGLVFSRLARTFSDKMTEADYFAAQGTILQCYDEFSTANAQEFQRLSSEAGVDMRSHFTDLKKLLCGIRDEARRTRQT